MFQPRMPQTLGKVVGLSIKSTMAWSSRMTLVTERSLPDMSGVLSLALTRSTTAVRRLMVGWSSAFSTIR